jgi:hypothetical protein
MSNGEEGRRAGYSPNPPPLFIHTLRMEFPYEFGLLGVLVLHLRPIAPFTAQVVFFN